MKKINSLILLLVRLVFRRYKWGKFLQLFLQLPKYVLRIYVVRCFKLLPGILTATFFLLHATFLATSITYFEKCRSLI